MRTSYTWQPENFSLEGCRSNPLSYRRRLRFDESVGYHAPRRLQSRLPGGLRAPCRWNGP
jgi:hypothetical protein